MSKATQPGSQPTSSVSALARVVLGVTGGIAAYKAAELTRLMVKAGIVVDVVMTDAATHFVTPVTFQALSGRPVLTDLWESGAAMQWATSPFREARMRSSWRRRPRISWPSWRRAAPTTCCPRCAWRANVRCSSRRR